ncbi:hypothetical protein [uncultured Phycicoccus sp.]|uniref:hypothetical protein n=1 Tax=uncultured Phycicoccus sp. TaxID=661422 RepID=UPI0026257ACE|nr:hypothetical protein [uncultured Phycicoccus sp.]
MRRGARVLVLLAVLVVGGVLLLTREAAYVATATVTAVDAGAAGQVEARATAAGFAGEVAEALAAEPASALPALTVTRSGAEVRVGARDVDPARAQDTVDTAAYLLARGATADAVEDTTSSTLPTEPVNRSSLFWLALATAALVVAGLVGSRLTSPEGDRG